MQYNAVKPSRREYVSLADRKYEFRQNQSLNGSILRLECVLKATFSEFDRSVYLAKLSKSLEKEHLPRE